MTLRSSQLNIVLPGYELLQGLMLLWWKALTACIKSHDVYNRMSLGPSTLPVTRERCRPAQRWSTTNWEKAATSSLARKHIAVTESKAGE